MTLPAPYRIRATLRGSLPFVVDYSRASLYTAPSYQPLKGFTTRQEAEGYIAARLVERAAHALQEFVDGLHSRGDGRLLARVIGDRVEFVGGEHGGHSLDVASSSQERIAAHFRGYCENSGTAPGALNKL